MGLGSLMAGIGAAIGGAIASAAGSSGNKNSSSSNSNKTSSSSGSSSRPSSSGSTAGFDKNVDYSTLIDNAVAKGDYGAAAQYEQQRNNKINAGYGGGYQTTNKYSQYLPGGTSGSGSSSGSSTGASGGSLGTQMTGGYKPLGVYEDADLKKYFPDVYKQIEAYKNQYDEAYKLGDKSGMQAANDAANNIRKQYGYSGGIDGSQFIPTGMGYTIADMASQREQTDALVAQMEEAAKQREQQYQQMMDGINAQYEAMLGNTMVDINAQKDAAAKQTALNNAAAEQAYMTAIKPNGSLAENLAANGLLTSGMTESSQIQAGNTYQNALNQNITTQTEALAELERMAIQAEYNNDISRLQAIQQLMQQIAENGYASAMDIAQIKQWGIENNQNNQYQQQQINMQMQQLELQKQQLQQDLANGKIDQQTAQAQLQLLNQQIEEAKLNNQYNKYQLGQLGIS